LPRTICKIGCDSKLIPPGYLAGPFSFLKGLAVRYTTVVPFGDDTTQLLHRVARGEAGAENDLLPRIYQDLRRLAAGYLRRERQGHTLQPTDLVHEAYLRLLGPNAVVCQDRPHFFRLAASAMRRILVDHARGKNAEKRGRGATRVPLGDSLESLELPADQILDLDTALNRLAQLDQRQVKIVEMRFFAGLSEDEIADALELSTRTVKREWAMARAWLAGELGAGS
jgi:RNA polymerase sigma factor (TIGR02999 family)